MTNLSTIALAIVVATAISCGLRPNEVQNVSTGSKDTVWSQNLQPAESGYADVNGLKMYYEVYGQGKPIVLLHGLPKSRLAILPGTTHIGMFMQHENWLLPMISDFLDSDLNQKPPTF